MVNNNGNNNVIICYLTACKAHRQERKKERKKERKEERKRERKKEKESCLERYSQIIEKERTR